MKNWYKALLLASLFYAFVIILFFYTELPKAKEVVYTPLNLSLYEEPIEKKDIYQQPLSEKKPPKKEPVKKIETPKKEPEKTTNVIEEVKNQKPKEHQNDINASIAVINEEELRKESLMPSISQINTLFEKYEPKKEISKEINDLYGEMAHSLSKKQLEYLDENLHKIGAITQKYLEFPAIAGQLGMFGDTILEFDLYPNGDISEIMLLKSSGYAILDKNSKETVLEAYKEYPHPREITKIRLLVKYINSYR